MPAALAFQRGDLKRCRHRGDTNLLIGRAQAIVVRNVVLTTGLGPTSPNQTSLNI